MFPVVDIARRLASGIPDARLALLEGSSAVPFLGDKEEVITAIDEFLSEGEEATAPAAAPSGLVTILFTDMEGSTTLTQRLGDAKAQDVLHAHNAIVRDALKACGGSEIKHTGDGIMASFPSASRALECAIAVQRAVAAQAQEHPEMPLRVRIGLNAGEPVAEDQDLFGTAVQLAARICARAEPGQILVPTVVRELAAGKGFLLADLGEIALRGFEDPVRLYEVRWREPA
jgi:adenylate cyclase